MRLLIAAFIALFVFSLPLAATEKEEIVKTVEVKIQQVIKTLQDKSIDKNARNNKIIQIINPLIDFDRMAKLSLGKKYWLQMNKKQQVEFVDLFVKRLQESYLEKLDLYTDEDVVVEDAVQVKKRIHILTKLVTKDDKKDMLYKFYRSKKGWMCYDVEILGVSVVQTYRSQFDGVLRDGSVEDLLKKLRVSGQFSIPHEDKLKKK